MRLRNKPNAIPEMEKNHLMIFDGSEYKGRWKEIFGNKNPIELEIGAGMGDFITKLSKENSDKNFLALEMNTNAFVVASRKFKENELTNVRGIIGDAENLEEMFEKGEISKIYINFSTPWPKTRHHKRRLSHKRFLDRYKKIIVDGAILEMKTDNREFFDDSLEYFEENNMEILEKNFDISLEDSKIITEYEAKWREKNVPICFARVKFL